MRKTASSLRVRLLLLGAAAALAFVSASVIPTGATPPEPQPAAPATTAPPVKGPDAVPPQQNLRAFIDPETGLIGPPAGQPMPEETVSKPAAEAVLTVLPDGSEMLELNGTIEDYMIIQLDADGQKTFRCVEDPKAVLQVPPPKPQREDR